MKKWLKIILCVICIIILIFVIDLICIFTINRPLFAIRTDNDDSINIVYRGLFYDTYDCAEYSLPQIKLKGSKLTCSISRKDIGKVIDIIDMTKDMKDFNCIGELEEFYEDENFKYYFNCVKSKYIIVKYESGFEDAINNALKYGSIIINDLDDYNIDYIKQEKEMIEKDDIIADNGLLFSITWKRSNCIPVLLSVYDKSKYELYTSYEACGITEVCNLMLKYTKKESGIYDYDIMKIINNSTIADNMTFSSVNRPEFEIYTGNGEKVYSYFYDLENNKQVNSYEALLMSGYTDSDIMDIAKECLTSTPDGMPAEGSCEFEYVKSVLEKGQLDNGSSFSIENGKLKLNWYESAI